MKWVIAYDVTEDSARRRVTRRLEQLGFRRQYSVFEGELTVTELGQLMEELHLLLTTATDVVTAWPWTDNNTAKVIQKGRERTGSSQDWILI